ncbi:transmembrane protein [Rhodovulum sulfidophilum]|uniref:Transmembrane protein n=1 Tax=Rhodovulum sulfidophilum TaxID=35806 RepID=A0A0D6B5I1_RHOSU|nr:transmembrane protein [Rhodovulum sulfidophilum]
MTTIPTDEHRNPGLHAAAGALGLALIASFWLSTLGAELFGTTAQIVAVKTVIPYGIILLVPALIVAGAGGTRLARDRRGPLVTRKARRMRVVALNGLLILVPSALFLAKKAAAQDFDTAFVLVQLAELAAGAVNLALLGANLRDGLAMRDRRLALR